MRSIDYAGRSVVITGAGSGIGRASALAFAECGADLAINDLNAEGLAETAAIIAERFPEADVVQQVADISLPETSEALVEQTLQAFSRLDVMFNNAGGGLPKAMHQISANAYRQTMALNMDAVYYSSQAALKPMLEQGCGVILATTSGAGINAMPGLSAYGAAKAGVIALMKSIAVEYGRAGIRANSISPGAMDTPGLMAWAESLPGGAEAYNDAQPQGRLGRPEEIADAAVYLASVQASFVNGATLPVDGAVQASLWKPSYI